MSLRVFCIRGATLGFFAAAGKKKGNNKNILANLVKVDYILRALLAEEDEDDDDRAAAGGAILTISATAALPFAARLAEASNGRAPEFAFVMLANTAEAPCFTCTGKFENDYQLTNTKQNMNMLDLHAQACLFLVGP